MSETESSLPSLVGGGLNVLNLPHQQPLAVLVVSKQLKYRRVTTQCTFRSMIHLANGEGGCRFP
jgi:hypothetical protein